MIPRWMKLKQAALYSSIGQKRLKRLAGSGEIYGYPDTENRGEWIFDKESIDEYRLKPLNKNNVLFNKLLAEQGLKI